MGKIIWPRAFQCHYNWWLNGYTCVFWNVTRYGLAKFSDLSKEYALSIVKVDCSLLELYQRSGDTCHLCLQGRRNSARLHGVTCQEPVFNVFTAMKIRWCHIVQFYVLAGQFMSVRFATLKKCRIEGRVRRVWCECEV